MKKLRMRVDELAVESFATAGHAGRRRGTVRGRGDDCTWFESCFCETAYAVCGTGPATIHSCTYTNDERCPGTLFDPCTETQYDACNGTAWEVCGTGTPPQFTPAC
jgi:hypothetical protein